MAEPPHRPGAPHPASPQSELPIATRAVLQALGQFQGEDRRDVVDLAVVRARALELLAGTDAASEIAPEVGSYAGLERLGPA